MYFSPRLSVDWIWLLSKFFMYLGCKPFKTSTLAARLEEQRGRKRAKSMRCAAIAFQRDPITCNVIDEQTRCFSVPNGVREDAIQKIMTMFLNTRMLLKHWNMQCSCLPTRSHWQSDLINRSLHVLQQGCCFVEKHRPRKSSASAPRRDGDKQQSGFCFRGF